MSVETINNFETNTRRTGGHDGSRRQPHAAKPAGRYDRRSHNTRAPAEGLARSPLRKGDTIVAAVPDPWGDGTERILATINRRVDILEQERSAERISEAAYRTGRLIQAIFERLGRVGGSNWCGASRIDPMLAQQLNIIRCLMSARQIAALEARIVGRLGMVDMRLLRRIIGERMSFEACAGLQGKSGERGRWYVSNRFRDALEELAEAWVGRGKVIPTPDDVYKAASADMDGRQKSSIDMRTEPGPGSKQG